MPIVPDKYRGTSEYDQIREILVQAAKIRNVVFYHPTITRVLGLDEPGDHMGRELGHVLGEISEDEHNDGRPMLRAAGISKNNRPGSGFFDLARLLGKEINDEDEFWQQELHALYEYWSS